MIREYRGLVRTNEDGSEIVNYDDPSFPSYIYDGYFYGGCTWEKVPHFHKDVELLSVHSSCMGYSVNGSSIFLEKGDTIFVNSDQLHYSYALPPREARYIISVLHPRILCSNYAVESKAIMPVISNKKIPYIHFRNGDRDAADIQALMFELHHKSLGNEFLITKTFFEIWEIILNRFNESGRFSQDQTVNQDLHNEVLKAMMNYVDKNYMNNITLTEIAEQTGFSNASYMAETFKKFYMLSPREYKKAMEQ